MAQVRSRSSLWAALRAPLPASPVHAATLGTGAAGVWALHARSPSACRASPWGRPEVHLRWCGEKFLKMKAEVYTPGSEVRALIS